MLRPINAILHWLYRQAHARPLAMIAVCFLAGILIAQCVPVWVAGIAVGLFLAGSILVRGRRRMLPILLLVASLGCVRMQCALKAYPPVETQFSVSFTGKVASDPLYDSEKERIICAFQLDSIDGQSSNARVRLYLRSDLLPLSGIEYDQTLACFGHVWSPDAVTNPHEFNQRNWLLASGMTGMAAAKLEDAAVSPASPSLGRAISLFRARISERIDLLFPKSADLVRAFVLGDRSGLDDSLTDAFRDAGITHLICISGMHVSVLAAAVSALLGSFLPRRAAMATTIALVILYGLLIGFPASLVRAASMFALFNLAVLAGRPSDAVTRIATALLGMLIVWPFYVLSAGFVLSFGATAGLILLDSPIEALLKIDGMRRRIPSTSAIKRLLWRLARYFPQLLAATLAAQIAILPALVQYFGLPSLISVPANLLAVPLAMLAYPIAMAALILSAIWLPLGRLFALVPDRMFALLASLAEFLSAHASEQIQIPNYPVWLIGIHALLCVAASDLTQIRLRVRKFLPIAIPALLGVSVLVGFLSAMGFGAIFLDAGQADAAVLHAGGHVYMIDTGDTYTPAADYASATCAHLDAIFLSHPHRDHAGGLTRVLERIRPSAIYVPDGWFEAEADEEVSEAMALAEKLGVPIRVLYGGDELQLPGGITLRVTASKGGSVNDLSQLLAFTCRGRTILFTGDLSQAGEPDVYPTADILKTPHHGSAKACSADLLDAVRPEIAILSVGRDNSYGHPADETLRRLADAGCAVYRTDQCGAISIRISRSGNVRARTFLSTEESK